jgi:hypothetical protein
MTSTDYDTLESFYRQEPSGFLNLDLPDPLLYFEEACKKVEQNGPAAPGLIVRVIWRVCDTVSRVRNSFFFYLTNGTADSQDGERFSHYESSQRW